MNNEIKNGVENSVGTKKTVNKVMFILYIVFAGVSILCVLLGHLIFKMGSVPDEIIALGIDSVWASILIILILGILEFGGFCTWIASIVFWIIYIVKNKKRKVVFIILFLVYVVFMAIYYGYVLLTISGSIV